MRRNNSYFVYVLYLFYLWVLLTIVQQNSYVVTCPSQIQFDGFPCFDGFGLSRFQNTGMGWVTDI